MSEQVDVVICSGYSPGARVLRAAVRELANEEDIRIVTVVPALSGLPSAEEEMRALQFRKVIVVDGCEGVCGLQVLNRFGVMPRSNIMIEKHFQVTRKGIDDAKNRIRAALKEVEA